MTQIIAAVLPSGERRYAAVDPTVRFTPAGVGGSRLSAMLRPYRTEGEAVAAIQAEGGTVEDRGVRRPQRGAEPPEAA